MDTGQTPQQPILETLRTVEFRLGLKGYNVDEVDEYLEKVAVEAERLTEQVREMTERLDHATENGVQPESVARLEAPTETDAPVPSPVADEALQQTLIMAQRFVEQAKRESEAEATQLVTSAEERAQSLVTRAEEEAHRLMTEGEQQLREEVNRLEAMRAQLIIDVESMARHLDAERTRLRTMLSEVLKWIEENVQPAESLMDVRPRAAEDGGRQATGRPGSSKPSQPEEPAEPVEADEHAEDKQDEAQSPDANAEEPTTVTSEPRS